MLVCELLSNAKCPVVLDADGLNAVANHIDVLKTVLSPLVLTPHPGEMARLSATDIAFIEADRLQIAKTFAARYGVTLALKGHRTVITDGVVSKINTTGNAGMATGGSGDVLTGMVLALLAQGYSATDAARMAVYVHGFAGDFAVASKGHTAMVAGDIVDCLPYAWLHLERKEAVK
jgi:NAD(P)H-hydrate epimerase